MSFVLVSSILETWTPEQIQSTQDRQEKCPGYSAFHGVHIIIGAGSMLFESPFPISGNAYDLFSVGNRLNYFLCTYGKTEILIPACHNLS